MNLPATGDDVQIRAFALQQAVIICSSMSLPLGIEGRMDYVLDITDRLVRYVIGPAEPEQHADEPSQVAQKIGL